MIKKGCEVKENLGWRSHFWETEGVFCFVFCFVDCFVVCIRRIWGWGLIFRRLLESPVREGVSVSIWGTLGLRCLFSGTPPVKTRSSPRWHKDGVKLQWYVSYHHELRSFWIKLTLKQILCYHAQYTFESVLTMWCLGCAEYWPLDRSGSWLLIQTQTRICTQGQCIQNIFVEIFFDLSEKQI